MDEILRRVQQTIAGDRPGTLAADDGPRSAEILSVTDAAANNSAVQHRTQAPQAPASEPPQVVTVLLDWRDKNPDQRLLFPRANGTVQPQKQPWVRWQQL
jgi:hypothetical protein